MQTNNRATYSDYLGNSVCGFDGYDYLVCCQNPSATNPSNIYNQIASIYTPYQPAGQVFQFGPAGGTTTGSSGNYPPYAQQGYPGNYPIYGYPGSSVGGGSYGQYTLPRESICGLSSASTNRVVGGNEAQRGAYPWIAALGYETQGYGGVPRFLCSGSLITQRHVLTSAHCVTAELYSVRLGAHNINANNQQGVSDVAIQTKILHPNFDSRTITNDLALLKLVQDVPITSTIRPICLPVSEPLRSMDYTSYNPFIAGWGAVTFQGPTSAVLRDAQIPIINTRTCEANYRTRFPTVSLGNDIICAGDGVRDACQGDSGGPLMLPELSPDRTRYNFYLIGVVSYGYECARATFPGVYMRVSPFIPWIESQLNV
ncbi:unnamed protein product [Hermetia illucens]|uniref:Peptidase S1 domain-containing protein n=2 Tax=Hermetia illucens TaxID=343691 RepID=A0A7R8UM49_HERIL|nr:unnamed protein product [Hermetia illucens]